jgi:ribonuclease HII
MKNNLKIFDQSYYANPDFILAGVDEAGRGPLAGPVVAAAVIFNREAFHPKVNDSKKINGKTRDELFLWINENCVSSGIGIVDHEEIDRINILQASLKAMRIAVGNLAFTPDLVLIDGNKKFVTKLETRTVVKGDAKSFSIAAASILAKVTRDKLMKEASDLYPQYKWAQNKGYATKAHIGALMEFGAVELHRKTFLKKIFERSGQLKF